MNFEEPTTENREEEKREYDPEVVLNEKSRGEEFPEGEPDEVRQGFSFFAKVERESEDGKEIGWEYITSDIGERPVLTAVTEDQKESWDSKELKALSVNFVWDEEDDIWQVVSDLEYKHSN